ncbi:MAG: glucosaminidase domain-containing protein [Pyrinomonadaceae bacterium]
MEKVIISDWDPMKGSKVYFVNLRPQPDKEGDPLGEVTAGSVVEKLGESAEWSKVRLPLRTDAYIGAVEGWVITRLLKEVSEQEAEFSIDTDLKAVRSQLTAEQIDGYLRSKNAPIAGIGRFVVETAARENVNATFICALANHESNYGTSPISKEKFNLFGWNAVDASPGASANSFDSYEHCISFVVQRINELYLTPGGKYFVGRPCLGGHAEGYGMNVKYTPTDPVWGSKVAAHARAIENWAEGRPESEPESKPESKPERPSPTTPSRPVGDLIAAINRVNPSHRYYQAQDITGDHVAETFCNWFAGDVLALLKVFLPTYKDADNAGHYPPGHPIYGNEPKNKPWSADLLNRYFREGGGGKWHRVTRREAVTEANRGGIVVASVPKFSGRSGHIAIVRPDSSGTNVRVAQAGKESGPDMTIEKGFGRLTDSAEFYKYGA